MYTPQNVYVFLAAYNGAISGFGVQGNNAVSPTPSRYIVAIAAAAAYAEEFDTAWGPTANSYQVQAVEDVSCAYWRGVGATLANANLFAPSGYMVAAAAIIALITEGANALVSLGIAPPAYPPGGGGGGVTAVTGVAPITSTGGGTPAIGLAPGGSGYVIFRPGIATSGQAVATWAEVVTAVAQGANSVYVDTTHGTATMPTGVFDTQHGAIKLYSWREVFSPGNGDILTMADGAQLLNPSYIGPGLQVNMTCTTTPAIVYSDNNGNLTLERCTLHLLNGAGIDGLQLGAGLSLLIILRQGTLTGPATGAFSALTAVGAGATLIVNGFEAPTYNARSVGSLVGTTAIIGNDASNVTPTQVNSAGTNITFQFDLEANLQFNTGTTGQRPAIPRQGERYFDSSIQSQLVWNPAANGGTGAWQSPATVAKAVTPNGQPFLGNISTAGAEFYLLSVDLTPEQSALLNVSAHFLISSALGGNVSVQAYYIDNLTAVTGGTPVAAGIVNQPTSTTPPFGSGVLASQTPTILMAAGEALAFDFPNIPVQAVQNHRTGIVFVAQGAAGDTLSISCNVNVRESAN